MPLMNVKLLEGVFTPTHKEMIRTLRCRGPGHPAVVASVAPRGLGR